MPPPDYAPRLEGVPGVRRLPLSCKVGDWTHYEWLARRGEFPNPPPMFKVMPRPKTIDWTKFDKANPPPFSILDGVMAFQRFDYYQNDVLLHAYRRIQ